MKERLATHGVRVTTRVRSKPTANKPPDRFADLTAQLTQPAYVTTSQPARRQHLRRKTERPQTLRARRNSQKARPVEGRRPRHRPAQNQGRRVRIADCQLPIADLVRRSSLRKKSGIGHADCANDSFPLTPALSLGEREAHDSAAGFFGSRPPPGRDPL